MVNAALKTTAMVVTLLNARMRKEHPKERGLPARNAAGERTGRYVDLNVRFAALLALRTAELAHNNLREPRFLLVFNMHSALVPKLHCVSWRRGEK